MQSDALGDPLAVDVHVRGLRGGIGYDFRHVPEVGAVVRRRTERDRRCAITDKLNSHGVISDRQQKPELEHGLARRRRKPFAGRAGQVHTENVRLRSALEFLHERASGLQCPVRRQLACATGNERLVDGVTFVDVDRVQEHFALRRVARFDQEEIECLDRMRERDSLRLQLAIHVDVPLSRGDVGNDFHPVLPVILDRQQLTWLACGGLDAEIPVGHHKTDAGLLQIAQLPTGPVHARRESEAELERDRPGDLPSDLVRECDGGFGNWYRPA